MVIVVVFLLMCCTFQGLNCMPEVSRKVMHMITAANTFTWLFNYVPKCVWLYLVLCQRLQRNLGRWSQSPVPDSSDQVLAHLGQCLNLSPWPLEGWNLSSLHKPSPQTRMCKFGSYFGLCHWLLVEFSFRLFGYEAHYHFGVSPGSRWPWQATGCSPVAGLHCSLHSQHWVQIAFSGCCLLI